MFWAVVVVGGVSAVEMAPPVAEASGRAWVGPTLLPDASFEFPEGGGKRRGVCLSGGGARAFGAGITQLSTLDTSKVDYVTGTSGGSWALAVWAYGKQSVEAFEPSALTVGSLRARSALEYPSLKGGMFKNILDHVKDLKNSTAGKLWADVVWETYLAPANVSRSAPLASNDTRGVFPLIGFSIWGQDPPRMLAASPLYVGTGSLLGRVGGLLEPQVFGCDAYLVNDGAYAVGKECRGLSLAEAIAASSWAPGGLLYSIFNLEGIHYPYAAPRDRPWLATLADGGNVENEHVSGMLQRNVSRLVVFVNTDVGLDLAWNASTTPPSTKVIAEELPAYFGVGAYDNRAFNYTNDQLFEEHDFVPLVEALQDSVRRGDGGVATDVFRTVENSVLGVKGGLPVNVTWCYLSPSHAWKAQLPKLTRLLIENDPRFEAFPHFHTARLDLELPELNVLSSLVAWVIRRNPHHFVFEDDDEPGVVL